MSPKYKLKYFNVRGRAEHIRFIFAYAGVEYEDERIPKERWPELKKKTPFGALPVLEVDGKQVSQSMAIARYLAREFKLTGKDEWEALKCDELVEALGDLKLAMSNFMMERDPAKKEETKKKLITETIPYYLSKFDKIIDDNNGYSVGSDITWTDLMFASALENFETLFGKDALKPYPALQALKEKVLSLPSISEWIAKRPATDF